MENPFRRFLAARRLSSTTTAGPNRSLDDLALYSVSYESTSPNGKIPVFIHQPLRNGTAARRVKDETGGLAIRASPYDSTLAGKPPVMGGRPLRGNGPVKLQISRRLSSGELMITPQEPERTLEDIREGEYIVGRKEKRLSRASQARSPTPVGGHTLSSRLLSTGGAGSLPHLPLARVISRSSMKGSFVVPSRKVPLSNPNSPHASSFSTQVQEDDGAATSTLEVTSNNPRLSKIKDSAQFAERGSLLSQNEEQNATIQALWKAEYSRLVAIYGKDGVDRNILELNQDRRRSSSPMRTQATLDAMTALGMTLEPLPKPSFDSSSDLATRRHSRLSSTKDNSSTEENSDYASTVRSSVTSDVFTPSHTLRTSGFEPDLPTTREDVRKVVEDMRSTYLRAIEAKGNESTRSKKVKKRRERASSSAAGHVPSKFLSKTQRPTRQSWHPSNTPAAASPAISMERREQKRQTETFQTIETSPTRSLQRADSMTLGSLMQTTPERESNKRAVKSSRSHNSPQTPRAMLESPADLVMQHHASYYDEHEVLEPEVAPEIDDFDIFYQDLYPPPTASSMSSLPAKKHTSLRYDATAPAPPNIEWTPRRRYVSQI
jgi:hypothetical protein